jgi:phenylacetate-coenzyme A ligase PaaK-like adenylate-forming protein
MSVLEGLLSGNVNVLKTGGSESLFPQLFLEGLVRNDESGVLAQYLIAARISSKRTDLLEKIFKLSDGIAAWGGESAIESIRKLAPPHVRIIEWGHRISCIYVTPDYSRSGSILDAIAGEICFQEQQACSSPQCVYLETNEWSDVHKFAEDLADALARISPHVPRHPIDDSASAELTMVTLCHELEACYGDATVIKAEDGVWRVLADRRAALMASPLYRTIWVKPLPRERIMETLRPMRRYLQTIGLFCDLDDVHELSRLLVSSGATRVRKIGHMPESYPGEPHDGIYALPRYARRVSVQLPVSGRGISTFDELTLAPTPCFKESTPITPKEAFAAKVEGAQLFFKSGGSSGEPKLSTFTYQQYDDDMWFGAEGLYAAGLDPVSDRTMNLFFSGGLYGGFLSIFSALERLKAVQFPMAAHTDLEMVAKIIIDQKVNTLLGMPSYLMNLFEKNSEAFARYRGVRKIFYGGEHFTDAQRRHLKDCFGVELIRSGAYGSVDIGPMGFQCEFCEGGVHHLQQKLHYLEILHLEEDRPVQDENIGRLVFTPRDTGSNKPSRYAIGDVGHWVKGACSCGRLSPRFCLSGRTGDIFRIGSAFLNYQKFSQILSMAASYTGDMQICLTEEGRKEKLVLRLGKGSGLAADVARKHCLDGYHDLQEIVEGEKLLLFEVEQIPAESFERSSASGKLLRLLDRRKR